MKIRKTIHRLSRILICGALLMPLPPAYSGNVVAQQKEQPPMMGEDIDCNSEEHVKAILDFAAIERNKVDKTTTLFIIARLGTGETSRRLNQRRLYALTQYLIEYRGIPENKIVAAEGARVKGPGQVEIYVSAKLYAVLKMKRHRDFAQGPLCKIIYD